MFHIVKRRVLSARTYHDLAARLGFEPRYTAPEAVVLPLDDLAMRHCAPQGAVAYYRDSPSVSTHPFISEAPARGRAGAFVEGVTLREGACAAPVH